MAIEETGVIEKPPQDYIEEVIVLIRRKNLKNALRLAREASNLYPDDPIVLSYYGYLTAAAGKKRGEGINTCKEALKLLKKSHYKFNATCPALYLNLGRAYLAVGDRKRAFDAFHKGLARDKKNADLLWELKKLGIRRPPVISFLKRTNPLNRFLGRIRHWWLTR